MKLSEDAQIDVVMRTGRRNPELLHRAVASLSRQTAGRIRLILVRHGAADVTALSPLKTGALEEITVVDAPGANRSRAMAAGLARVTAPRFALLDDDDYLLEDHFHALLTASGQVPSPSFAYADILALDESPLQTGLSVWRSGPAEAPLGRITDRISAHAFLVETAALQGVPFAAWSLETVEDALLIVSLLAKATPVHSPSATCIYSKGRGDDSDYLRREDRAADELAFATAIAPIVTVVEGKFDGPKSDPDTFILPFITAARRAELFTGLRARPEEGAAIRDDRRVVPILADEAWVTLSRRLIADALAGTVDTASPGPLEIGIGSDYAYAARLVVDEPAGVRPVMIAVKLRATSGVFGLALVDGENAIVTESTIEPLPTSVEVQALWEQKGPPSVVVRRLTALSGPEAPRLQITDLHLAYAAETLAPGQPRSVALAKLDAFASAPRKVYPSVPVTASGNGSPLALEGIGADGLVIDLGETAWAYVMSCPLPPQARGAAIRVELSGVTGPAYLLRVDEAWNQVGERLEAPSGGDAIELWMEAVATPIASRLVIQAGAAPAGRRVTLRGVVLFAPPGGERLTSATV